jgi:hypothetical protein
MSICRLNFSHGSYEVSFPQIIDRDYLLWYSYLLSVLVP